MADLIGSVDWENYKEVINDGHDTFNKEIIVWRRSKGGIDRYNEDTLTERFDSINLECLLNFNVFRTWPSFQTTESGELDRQTLAVYLNIKYLDGLGYLSNNNRLDFQPDADRFVYDGIVYKASGDTKASQAQDEPLHYIIILKREEISTGDKYEP